MPADKELMKYSSLWSVSEESGYSSDTSSVSSKSLRIRELRHSSSDETFSTLLTPEVKWKSRLRISSTPYQSSEQRQMKSPIIDPDDGPILKNRKFSNLQCSPLVDNIFTTDSISQTSKSKSSDKFNKVENQKCVKVKFKEIGRKSLFKFRSPLKSPSKSSKKYRTDNDKNESHESTNNKEVKDKSVKKLFSEEPSQEKNVCESLLDDSAISDSTKFESLRNDSAFEESPNKKLPEKNDSGFEDDNTSKNLSLEYDSAFEDHSTIAISEKSNLTMFAGKTKNGSVEKKSEYKKLNELILNKEARDRSVRQLFINKIDTPLRRVSPRLSNIVQRLMNESPYLLPKIFSFLNTEDLINISHVNHVFRQIILTTISLKQRIDIFFEDIVKRREKFGKENMKVKDTVNDGHLSISSPRKHLQQLQNTTESPQKAQSSSSSLSLFDKFVREGKKLVPGEIQMKCIQCHNPARVIQSEYKAICSKESCQFIFCTRCSMPFHSKPSNCLSLKPRPKVPSATKILTKACKKRLRRL